MPAFLPASPEECPQECGPGRQECLLHGPALNTYGWIMDLALHLAVGSSAQCAHVRNAVSQAGSVGATQTEIPQALPECSFGILASR